MNYILDYNCWANKVLIKNNNGENIFILASRLKIIGKNQYFIKDMKDQVVLNFKQKYNWLIKSKVLLYDGEKLIGCITSGINYHKVNLSGVEEIRIKVSFPFWIRSKLVLDENNTILQINHKDQSMNVLFRQHYNEKNDLYLVSSLAFVLMTDRKRL